MDTNLLININPNQWPIIYSPSYNVQFFGLEKLHPFDVAKWKNIFKYLKNAGMINEDTVISPLEAKKMDLKKIHSSRYLRSLKYSFTIAIIAEVFPLCLIPNCLVQKIYLKPMRFQTGGTILAGKLALERGWAINLGGGFHHCSSNKGGGFCIYADISLLIYFLLNYFPLKVQNVMVVDLDAHQGNGYARDFRDEKHVYILDVYNKNIYPFDEKAKKFINRSVELDSFTEDEEYLAKIESNLQFALNEFETDVVIYNAGTDILKNDPLGCLSISAEAIVKRDELVFNKVRAQKKIPIIMLLSGGYLRSTARIIASSIINLRDAGYIEGPELKQKY